MKPLLRLGASALVGILTVTFVCGVVLPALGAPMAHGDLGAAFQLLWTEQLRTEELVAHDRALWRSLDAKQETVHALIAGRMTLVEAAERFARANTRLADDEERSIASYQAVPGEWLMENVIQWVTRYLDHQPQQRDRLVARLRRELKQYRLSRGAL